MVYGLPYTVGTLWVGLLPHNLNPTRDKARLEALTLDRTLVTCPKAEYVTR